MSAQLIQIVNEGDEPISEASIAEAHQKNLIHRIVRIMVEDGQGNILLQKRLSDRDLYPDCWDNSAAGHVDAGESYETAAKRELHEEIGIDVELKEISTYRTHGKFEGRQLNRFNKAYRAVVPADTKFEIQADEVAEVRWFTIPEIKQLLSENHGQVTDGLIEIFERFY